MEQLSANIFTDTKLRGCNPSYVTTSDGVVVIDTPQLPTKAVAMRREAESHGPIRYVINTEHHVDHIFGNYYFKGAGTVVNHQGVYDNFMVVYPELDPFAYAYEALPTPAGKGTDLDDPEGVALWPDRDEYYADPNKGTIVFTGDLTLRVGDHTFHCLHTPGHTPGQVAVHVPEERTVFTGDTIFSGCQTWLMTSNVDQWIASLDRIRALDVDRVVPGHGPVTTKAYVDIAAGDAPRMEDGGRGRRGQGLVTRGDRGPGELRRSLPGRHRPGLHDELHPDAQRRIAVGQADGGAGCFGALNGDQLIAARPSAERPRSLDMPTPGHPGARGGE